MHHCSPPLFTEIVAVVVVVVVFFVVVVAVFVVGVVVSAAIIGVPGCGDGRDLREADQVFAEGETACFPVVRGVVGVATPVGGKDVEDERTGEGGEEE